MGTRTRSKSSADLNDNIVTSAKIVDGTIVDADINDLAASKLTGALPAIDGASLTGISAGTDWQSVVTGSTLTAVAGRGYPIDTTSNACTVTLPALPSVGDFIEFTDYARTWGTNAVTINPNSLKYQGNTTPQPVYNTNGESIRIVYVDTTQGWVPTSDGAVTLETPQNYSSEWLCIAGGGGGGPAYGGGGGAGGYRLKFNSENSGGGTNTESTITFVGGTTYNITVGDGGAHTISYTATGSNGGDSSIIGGAVSLTSTGGGGGACESLSTGLVGGSGGGGAKNGAGGAGTANQGYAGGAGPGTSGDSGGAGGGASAVGQAGSGMTAGDGGAGLSSLITGSSTARGGGGGGASWYGSAGTGADGGGNGGVNASTALGDATANTGGGGGGGPHTATGGDGGSGIVVLRMADGNAGTPSGEDSVATNVGGSGETVITWLVSGSYIG